MMLSNYFKLTFRNLRRNTGYLVINVLGLGFALGFAILSFLNYRFAHTYDHWHRDAERIVQVQMVKAANGAPYGVCPGALATAAKVDLGGVEDVMRYDVTSATVKCGDRVFNEDIHFADEHFFQFFDFPLKSGRADLSDRNSLVITEETAQKYFGESDPIGQVLTIYADAEHPVPLRVSGVLKNIPLNSSIRFRFLTHSDNQWEAAERFDYNSWKRSVAAIFLKLKSPADMPTTEAGLSAYVAPRNTARPDWTVSGYRLTALRDLALNSRDLRENLLWRGLPDAAVWGNITMALLLLLTASLNFANMTIAICNRRLREMGVRKVMGGTRWQLMRQLMSENLIVVALASGLGMLLAFPIADWFNSTWKFTDLRVDYHQPQLLLFILISVLLTTLLAGSYPAFYISGFRPASIFRGGVLFGGRNFFSRTMMGLQVAISLIAVVVGISFAQNADFNRRADIGFDYQPILQAWLPTAADFPKFNDAVRDIPGVMATAGSQDLPGFGYNNVEAKWQGTGHEVIRYGVGNNFQQILGMRLAQGEWPAPAGDTVASAEVVVSQTFVREVAENGPVVGETIILEGQKRRISGVAEDFITNSPFDQIRPSVLLPMPMHNYRRCLIKTATLAQQPQIMADIAEKWRTLFPYTPFNVGYQNEMLAEAAEVSDNIALSMIVFAGVAILLTITGLFSLVSLNVLQRMREVAIRRVMGASSSHIAWILNKNYIWIFGGAVLAGCFAGYSLALLLMDSIFKINIGVRLDALFWSALSVLGIATATIAVKLLQTLRVNPADVLRGD